MTLSHLLIALIVPIFIQSNAVFGQPLVTGVTPNRGSTGGGTLVTITGSDFTDATAVTFGGRAAESFTVVNNGTIQAQTPVGTIGAAQVAVASSSGVSPANSPDDLFVYVGVWFAYETDADDGTVTVVNITNNTAGFIIPVGNQPNGIAITPDAKTAYVVNFGSNNVTPIDLATNTPGAPIPVGAQPVAIAITIDGKTAFVTNQLSNNVTPIDLATNTPEIPFPVGLSPISIAATPNNVIGYVANFNESDITVFDMTTKNSTTIQNQNNPAGIAMTPGSQTAYVSNNGANTVTPIDLATNTPGTPIPVGFQPVGVAITSSSTKAYVATTSAVVTPIDLTNNAPQPSINVGDISTTIAITPDNQTAYVTVGANAVVPIDIASNTAGAPIFVGNGPYGIVITPDQAPVAIFSAAPDASNGLTISFDASNSVSPVGTIVIYGWDFGDGTIVNTSTPTIKHTYAMQGSFDVTLTVVNSAGTSTFPLFTGQTVSNNGGPNALLSRTIEVSATLVEPIRPPVNLRGRQRKDESATQTDFVNILTWEAPTAGAAPVSYRIYRDRTLTKLIEVVRANKKLRFEDHDRKKGKTYSYFIVSVDQAHRRSAPASIIVTPKRNDK